MYEDHPSLELGVRVRKLETDKSNGHYKAGLVGGILGFILSLVTQFWPQICAMLHYCVAAT
jgi:hypothetical protein